ncbi:hypothetical protein [Chitinophaga sp. RAB17]|uniref:hypothetical protein n=1 Tax=Chitinophaga sp. RAB17 TaxID=3233049 RepID=UPI003F92F095
MTHSSFIYSSEPGLMMGFHGCEEEANTNPAHDENSKDRIVRRLDCAVIRNIHILINLSGFKPFDAVKGVFFEGDPLYDGVGFNDKTHIQICIRNPNCIKGIFSSSQNGKMVLKPSRYAIYVVDGLNRDEKEQEDSHYRKHLRPFIDVKNNA